MLYFAERMPLVLVISPDWSLRVPVRAELREAGVDARGLETGSDLVQIAPSAMPWAIVVDGSVLQDVEARNLLENIVKTIPVLVVDSRTTPASALPGAEVLRRPVRVQEIVAWVLAQLPRRYRTGSPSH